MIEEKTLEFLGYPDYKVNTLGEIYRFRFHKSNLNESQIKEILKLSKLLNYKSIIEKFNISITSYYRIIKTKEKDYWQLMKPRKMKTNHLQIMLYNKQKKTRYLLHRLILLAFVGPCPKNHEGCHNDGNPKHNYLKNLRWDTHANNLKDRIKHKTMNYGERQGRSKLKNKDVLMIRYLNKFCTQKEISTLYNVDPSNISNIIKRKIWTHI